MRRFAQSYDLLRRCLEIRKDELRTLEWTITVRDRKDKKRMHELQAKYHDEIRTITEFFRFPDAAKMEKVNGKWKRVGYVSYSSWLSSLLEDMLVIDALTIYPRFKRNGELLALERIDGAMIKPMLGIDGRIPLSGPAYQQYVYGVPRESFTIDELIYKPYYPSNTTPYGNSLINQIYKHIKLAISSEEFLSAFFSDGSIPPQMFTAPESWDMAQILEFMDILNARLSGNPKALREFNVLPHGAQKVDLKPFDFKNDYMNYVAVMTCVLTGVQPTTVGIQPANSGLGGKSFSQQAQEIHDMQLSYTAKWLQELFTEIIQKQFGNDDLEFMFTHLIEREESERATINSTLLMSGQKSLDDIYIEEGRDPLGVSAFVQVGDRLLGLPDLLALSKKGSVAVNLGQVGGHSLPDGTKTKDIKMPDTGSKVVTPNPRENEDATAKLDTSSTEPTEENKSKPSQPPKRKGDSTPKGPTVNTTKSVTADVTKSASDEEKRHTHELEMIFMAAYYSIMHKVNYAHTMMNASMVASAFQMTQAQQTALYNALYALKTGVYLDSRNLYAKEHGLSPISTVDTNTEILLRTQVSQAVTSIVNTYNNDVTAYVNKLADSGMSDMGEIVDETNSWLRDRNRMKAEKIAVTEISQPWNRGVFAVDVALNQTSEREYIVAPSDGVCANCQAMIAGSPYTYEDAINLPIPNHVGCVHFIESQPKSN